MKTACIRTIVCDGYRELEVVILAGNSSALTTKSSGEQPEVARQGTNEEFALIEVHISATWLITYLHRYTTRPTNRDISPFVAVHNLPNTDILCTPHLGQVGVILLILVPHSRHLIRAINTPQVRTDGRVYGWKN